MVNLCRVRLNRQVNPLLDEQAKKTMLRKIPHGIYVCGVKDENDVNCFTISWVTQSSFKPPLVVNCVNTSHKSYEMIKNSGVFSITFLESGQKEVAKTFFQPLHRVGNKFENVEFYLGEETGCPIISDSLGYVECKVVGEIAQGDHSVFVGEVVGAGVHREGKQILLEETGWQYGG